MVVLVELQLHLLAIQKTLAVLVAMETPMIVVAVAVAQAVILVLAVLVALAQLHLQQVLAVVAVVAFMDGQALH
jgi:hypothetical protein